MLPMRLTLLCIVSVLLCMEASLVLSSSMPCMDGKTPEGWLCSRQAAARFREMNPIELSRVKRINHAVIAPIASYHMDGVPEGEAHPLVVFVNNQAFELEDNDLKATLSRLIQGETDAELVFEMAAHRPSLLRVHGVLLVLSDERRTVFVNNAVTKPFSAAKYTQSTSLDMEVLVLRASFTDRNLTAYDSSCVTSTYQNTLFQTGVGKYSMRNTYEHGSMDLVSLSGQMSTDVKVIAYNASGDCDQEYYNWFNAVKNAFNTTYNYTQYDIVIALLPRPISSCSFAGRASLTTTGCPKGGCGLNIVLSCDMRVVAHETGHNLGWLHSGYGSSQYGDSSDLMGSGGSSIGFPKRLQKGFMPTTSFDVAVQDSLPYFATLDTLDRDANISSTLQGKLGAVLESASDSNVFTVSYRTNQSDVSRYSSFYNTFCGVGVHYVQSSGQSYFVSRTTSSGSAQAGYTFNEVVFPTSADYALRTTAPGCLPDTTADILIYKVGQLPTNYKYMDLAKTGCVCCFNTDSGASVAESRCLLTDQSRTTDLCSTCEAQSISASSSLSMGLNLIF